MEKFNKKQQSLKFKQSIEQEKLLKAQQELLKAELSLGKVLLNCTGGIVFLDKQQKQIKINAGSSRNGRDYNFSSPNLWRVCTHWEAFIIKSKLYKVFPKLYPKFK